MAGGSCIVYTRNARFVLVCLFVNISSKFALQFVEDVGNIVFYKNAFGLAATKAIHPERDSSISDSGIELEKSE